MNEVCTYCSKAFAEYPLIMSDDADQTVYHAACAVQLATEIMVDLFNFLARLPPMIGCLFSRHPKLLLTHEEVPMQSTNLRQIKAALWDQTFIGATQVSCPMGRVVAIRRRKGQLLAMIRGWGRWYLVESVSIEMQFALPNRRVPQTRGTPASARLKETRGGG